MCWTLRWEDSHLGCLGEQASSLTYCIASSAEGQNYISNLIFLRRYYGRGGGVGRDLGVGPSLGVGVTLGVAVGVATAEPECRTVDEWKRTRLASVGADFIIPNFLNHGELMAALF